MAGTAKNNRGSSAAARRETAERRQTLATTPRAGKSLRQRYADDNADPDAEIYALLRQVTEVALTAEPGRGVAQLIDSKVKALVAVNQCLKLDDERTREGEATFSLGRFAEAVHRLESKGKTQGEILSYFAQLAAQGQLPGVTIIEEAQVLQPQEVADANVNSGGNGQVDAKEAEVVAAKGVAAEDDIDSGDW